MFPQLSHIFLPRFVYGFLLFRPVLVIQSGKDLTKILRRNCSEANHFIIKRLRLQNLFSVLLRRAKAHLFESDVVGYRSRRSL